MVTEILVSAGYLQDDGATPLFVASLHGHDAVVSALLASGAAVNQRTVGIGMSVFEGLFVICGILSK